MLKVFMIFSFIFSVNSLNVIDGYEEFQREIAKTGDKLLLVYYYRPWCGACKLVTPAIERLGYNNHIKVLTVDTDQTMDIAKASSIENLPTFIYYKNGHEIDRFCGANEEKLYALVARNL